MASRRVIMARDYISGKGTAPMPHEEDADGWSLMLRFAFVPVTSRLFPAASTVRFLRSRAGGRCHMPRTRLAAARSTAVAFVVSFSAPAAAAQPAACDPRALGRPAEIARSNITAGIDGGEALAAWRQVIGNGGSVNWPVT